MLKQYPAADRQPVDLLFQALADPSRRSMVDRLTRGPASVSQLARPFAMSLPAVVQHLHVLEAHLPYRARRAGTGGGLDQRAAEDVGASPRPAGRIPRRAPRPTKREERHVSERSVTHDKFTIERTYDAPPERVFSAWSEPAAKARWFGRGDAYELDFRVGGAS
jgi:hypothetical protein